MRRHAPSYPGRILGLLAVVLILRVLALIVSHYRDYFPPDFSSDFLHGRERHFPGVYRWAFTAHILSGPVALLLGMILVSDRFRACFPRGHRSLGRVQVASVLLLVTPSGLVMARHAAAGPVGAVGLAALALATAGCVSMGAWSAMSRRFADHRRWMWRCYLLLCSSVVLRLMGGLATVSGVTASWFDPLAVWMSWLVPLSAFELSEWARGRPGFSRPDPPGVGAAPRRRETSVP